MTDIHLQDLDNALTACGWRIVAVHPGDDYRISASWEIQRSVRDPVLLIDFDGLDDMVTLPIEQAHACEVRGYRSISLYFRKPQRSRHLWRRELAEFVAAIETLSSEPLRDPGHGESCGQSNA